MWLFQIKKKININKYLKKNYDFIFCFRSKFILKKKLLKKNTFSINYHPSLPKYRDVGGANYALYNNNKFFGFTIHLMNKKIRSTVTYYHKPFIKVHKKKFYLI